jgi:hypothetical protein
MVSSDIMKNAQTDLTVDTPAVEKIMSDGPSIALSGNTDIGELVHVEQSSNDQRHIQFADFHEQYASKYIELADAKAGATFAVTAGILVYLIDKPVLMTLLKNPNMELHFVILALALVTLTVSAALAFAVVAPRLTSSPRDGFVFWGTVAGLRSASEFIRRATEATAAGLTAARLSHCYDLCCVCSKKYKLLAWSMRIALVGVVMAFFTIFIV